MTGLSSWLKDGVVAAPFSFQQSIRRLDMDNQQAHGASDCVAIYLPGPLAVVVRMMSHDCVASIMKLFASLLAWTQAGCGASNDTYSIILGLVYFCTSCLGTQDRGKRRLKMVIL